MTRLNAALTGIEAQLETEAVQVAVAVAGKLSPELVAREPLTEISALASEAFRQLVATPQIAIHTGADIFDATKEKLEEIARLRGFEGRLNVQSDANVATRRLPHRMGRRRRHPRHRGDACDDRRDGRPLYRGARHGCELARFRN